MEIFEEGCGNFDLKSLTEEEKRFIKNILVEIGPKPVTEGGELLDFRSEIPRGQRRRLQLYGDKGQRVLKLWEMGKIVKKQAKIGEEMREWRADRAQLHLSQFPVTVLRSQLPAIINIKKREGINPLLSSYRPISRRKSAIFSLSLLSLLLVFLSKSLSALSKRIWSSSSGSLPTRVAAVSAFSLTI